MLTTSTMNGKKVAEQLLTDCETTIQTEGVNPSLHVIFVGDDDASKSYISMKERKANEIGIDTTVHQFSQNSEPQDVKDSISALNNDSTVDGIIVQLPLPDHFNELELLETVEPRKDVDGLHPINFGKLLGGGEPFFYPPTPDGILKLLDHYDVMLHGKIITIVGMGRLVGRPLSQMFLNQNSTVICTNEHTPDLSAQTRKADVVIAGAGVPELITSEHIEPETVVIDAGIHKIDGELVGDVQYDEVAEIARLITPVPGGVGPLTVAGLLSNTVNSRLRKSSP